MDLSDRELRWHTAMGLASGLACVAFVPNYGCVVRVGSVAPVAVLALASIFYEAWRDVRHEGELTESKKYLTTIVTLAIFVPAVVLGIIGPSE